MKLELAIRCLEAGDWESAHRIVQADDSVTAAWAHGIVHVMEGDEANARYWYRRAGRPFPGLADAQVAAEIQALKRSMEGDQ